MADVTWYSISRRLEVEEREPVELAGALALVDRYLARLKPHYEWAEDCMAQTTFGFSRTPRDFIEISLHSADQIGIRMELPPPPKSGFFARLLSPGEYRFTVDSSAALRRHVTEYFELTPERLRERLQEDS